MNWKKYPFGHSWYNFRHHVGYGALWFSNSVSFLNGWDFDHIQEIADSILEPTDALGRNRIISGIPLLKLMEKYDKIAQAAVDSKTFVPPRGEPRPSVEFVAFDSVPISKNTCKTFILAKKEKKFEIWDSQGVVNQKPGPFKALPEVKNTETLDSPFTEDFYAFVRMDHYYFVTESGKLYHAPPPKKGEKSRTLKALWEDAKRPIAAVIEDADNDKVWLFTKSKDKLETQAVFFEMAAEIRQEKFDHAKLAPVNVLGRARPLLEYLPLIRDKAKKQQKE